MPLSFGVPLGIAVILIGLVLFLATNSKRLGKVIMGIGVVIALSALALVILAINSPM